MSKIRDALTRSKEEQQQRLGLDSEENSNFPSGLPQEVRGLADSLQVVAPIEYTQHRWSLEGLLTRGAEEDRLVASEELKKLCALLMRRNRVASEMSFMVTSAMPGEGKTFTSVHLAWTLAQATDQRVLLIDADLRSPAAHQMFGAPLAPGLAECLKGRADVPQALQRGPVSNLFFLPAGECRENSMGLLTTSALKNLVTRFSAQFDWIIIDTPPILSVSDTQMISPLVDGVLLVVGAGISSRESVLKARDMLSGSGVLGVVLNYVEARESYTSYYYQRYQEKNPRK